MTGQHISHPWLGVEIQDVTSDVAGAAGYNGAGGAVVRAVVAGGPADNAGIQEGDIITGWNGSAVADTDDLLTKIGQQKVGDKVALTIWRNQQSLKLTVTLADQPSSSS
jgi:serine protease DegQ